MSDSDDDVSSEARLAEERGARRFFTKRHRRGSVDAGSMLTASSVERQNTDAAQQGTIRRRMSKVVTRRNRTVPVMSSGSDMAGEGGGGDDTGAYSSPEDQDAVKNGEALVVDVNDSGEDGGGAKITETRIGNDRANGDAEEEAEQEEPPPFTMALAVMLTGFRVFVVDQVRLQVEDLCGDSHQVGRGRISRGRWTPYSSKCFDVSTVEVDAYSTGR